MGKDEEDSAAAANNEDQEKSTSAPVSVAERMAKLKQLHQRRQEARKLNHAEVVEEDRRNKMPANAEAKKRRQDWELQDMEARKAAEAAGEDYDRVKMLALQADTAEKIDAAKRRKQNPDPGFIDFEAASLRQYQRLTKQGKPDMQHYKEQKDKMGADFYATTSTLLQNTHYPSNERMDAMTHDLTKQVEKRAKHSRRRAIDPDAPVDFINERNRKFNEKIDRFYSPHTEEIKQSLERGTAV